eukprot:109650-Lingulodinium_polyedra.AAC.1
MVPKGRRSEKTHASASSHSLVWDRRASKALPADMPTVSFAARYAQSRGPVRLSKSKLGWCSFVPNQEGSTLVWAG